MPRTVIVVPPALQEANRFFMEGRFLPAAVRYAGLAAGAEQRNMPQATNFYLQAARAMLLAHHPDRAEQLAQEGLQILVANRRFGRLRQLGLRVTQEFENQGHKSQAQHLSAWLASVTPPLEAGVEFGEEKDLGGNVPMEEETEDKSQAVALPRFCPSCGAPVDPRDVEWVDHDTALCAFCAISLTGES